MASIPFELRITNFVGGLHDNKKASVLTDNQLSEAQNIMINDSFIQKRNGFDVYANKDIRSMYVWNKENDVKQLVGTTSGSKLTVETTPGVFVDKGTINNTYAKMVGYKKKDGSDILLVMDNYKLKTFDGTTVSEVVPYTPTTEETTNIGKNDLDKLTNVRASAFKDGRLIVQGNPKKRNMIHFSHIDLTSGYADYTYFPAVQAINLENEDNDKIIDIRVFRDALICFGERNIYAVYGTIDRQLSEDDRIVRLNTTSGCIASQSIVEVENSIFYLSQDGVYELYNADNNFVSARRVSDNISNTLKENKAYWHSSKGTYHNGCYYLNLNSGITLVYNYKFESWVTWKGFTVGRWLVRDNVLYFSDNASDRMCLFVDGKFTDVDTPIEISVKTKIFDVNEPISIKKLKEVWLVGQQYESESSAFNVKLIADYQELQSQNNSLDDSGVWGEGQWGKCFWGWVEVVREQLKMKAKCYTFQLHLTTNIAGPLDIYSIIFKGKIKKK